MVSRCVNPRCVVQLNLFGAGALYALEKTKTIRSSRHREYIWLCASCATRLTLQTDADGNVVVIPQSQTRSFPRSDVTSDLRLVFRSTWVPLLTASSIWKKGA